MSYIFIYFNTNNDLLRCITSKFTHKIFTQKFSFKILITEKIIECRL